MSKTLKCGKGFKIKATGYPWCTF